MSGLEEDSQRNVLIGSTLSGLKHAKEGGRPPRPRRTRLDIYAAILRALASDTLTMNQLVFHLRLNSRIARECVSELTRRGFAEVQRREAITTYSATQEGMNWVRRYMKVVL